MSSKIKTSGGIVIKENKIRINNIPNFTERPKNLFRSICKQVKYAQLKIEVATNEKPTSGKYVRCSITGSNKGIKLDVGNRVRNIQASPNPAHLFSISHTFGFSIPMEIRIQIITHKLNENNPNQFSGFNQFLRMGKFISKFKLNGNKNFLKYSKGTTEV